MVTLFTVSLVLAVGMVGRIVLDMVKKYNGDFSEE